MLGSCHRSSGITPLYACAALLMILQTQSASDSLHGLMITSASSSDSIINTRLGVMNTRGRIVAQKQTQIGDTMSYTMPVLLWSRRIDPGYEARWAHYIYGGPDLFGWPVYGQVSLIGAGVTVVIRGRISTLQFITAEAYFDFTILCVSDRVTRSGALNCCCASSRASGSKRCPCAIAGFVFRTPACIL